MPKISTIVTDFILISLVLLTACTINCIMNHTEGTASDMVDDTTTADVNAEASAQIPLK